MDKEFVCIFAFQYNYIMEQYNFGDRTNWKTVTMDGKTWRKSYASESTLKLRQKGKELVIVGEDFIPLEEYWGYAKGKLTPEKVTTVRESDLIFANLYIPQDAFDDCFTTKGIPYTPYVPEGPMSLHEEFMQWYESDPNAIETKIPWYKRFIVWLKRLFKYKK